MIHTTHEIFCAFEHENPDRTDVGNLVQSATNGKYSSMNISVWGRYGFVQVYLRETPSKTLEQFEAKLTTLLTAKGYKVI
jgi:hypothetical protein